MCGWADAGWFHIRTHIESVKLKESKMVQMKAVADRILEDK